MWRVLLGLLAAVSGQAPCDYSQYLTPGGRSFTIDSGGRYRAGSACAWRAFTNSWARIYIDCTINIPQEGQMCLDQLIISDTQIANDGIAYCGVTTVKHRSDSYQLLLQITASYRSTGGEFKCTIYSKNITSSSIINPDCACGYSYGTRIVGGVETGVNEFPMMAGIVSQSARDLVCGATIISQRYSVTAAHCLKGRDYSDLALLVGDHDITTGTETNSTLLVRVAQLFIYPYYNESKIFNDIGLIKLVGPLRFTSRVGPACLPFTYPGSLLREYVTAIGWGSTEFGGVRSTKLQKVKLQVVPQTDCQSTFGERYFPPGQICTFSPQKDACQWDSGGPLLWNDPITNRYILKGVLSYGRGCGFNYSSVNTNVYSYLGWIENIIKDDYYCVV